MSEATFEEFLKSIKRFGLEYLNMYYGTYSAVVENNNDPKDYGRVRISLPSMGYDDELDGWAWPITQYAGDDYGQFFVPEEGQEVHVCFENGDIHYPLYYGGWWGQKGDGTQNPNSFTSDDEKPKARGIETKTGHRLVFEEGGSDVDHASDRMIVETAGKNDEQSDTNKVELQDEKKFTEIMTIDGHQILLSDGEEGDQEILIKTIDGHEVRLSDTNKKINLTHSSGNTEIVMQSDKINITSSDIIVDGDNVTVNSGTVVVDSSDIQLAGGGNPVARVGDKTTDGASIAEGSSSVSAG